MRTSLLLSALAFLCAMTACGGDDDGTPPTDGGPRPDTGPGVDGGPRPDGGPGVDGGPGDAGGGTPCVSHLTGCGATEYCDFPDDLCGMGEPGVCRPRPTTCGSEEEPSCGCNMLAPLNACMVYMLGVDLNNNATCPPPAETFSCGSRICRQGMEYCQRANTDVGGTADTYDCIMLPAGCTACACLATVPCGDMCAASGAGDLTVTCLGG